MRRLIALLVGALVAGGLTVTAAQPALAGSTTVGGLPYGTVVTLDFPNVQWTDPVRCLAGTVTGTVNGRVTDDWGFYADITLKSDSTYTSYASYWGDTSGDFVAREAFQMCPKDHPNGVYQVSGYVWLSTSMSDTWAWVEVPFTTEFSLTPMPTATTLAIPTVVGTITTFSGNVVATSSTQRAIAADPAGVMAIETLSGSVWTRIGLGNPDASGFFAIPVSTLLPPGTQYRATYLGTRTCDTSSSPVQVVPTPPDLRPMPTVKLKAVSSRSKLKVDVNPNMGRKYWTFQVQRKNADGTWKALKTYRTKGNKETRTLNLRKGTYRVWVNPKFGYQGAYSPNEVSLKR